MILITGKWVFSLAKYKSYAIKMPTAVIMAPEELKGLCFKYCRIIIVLGGSIFVGNPCPRIYITMNI